VAKKPWELAVEDPVDVYWEKADGKIPRPKDTRFCKHSDRAMCDYCMPLEVTPLHQTSRGALTNLQPYDATYQAENKIKHLSYHAYLRKLDLATNKPSNAKTSFVPPLDEPDYRVKVPCPSGSHASWPDGICTKCQPSAITLQLQQYRMVDHVEFANPAIINRFLDFWRKNASQRFGYLLGHYETYERVPMGVRAVVEAIHEPPQEGDVDGIKVGMPWEDEARVEALAADCGLRVVGVIFTDLTPDTTDATKVVCKRHAKSFFLSSLETLFAARLQREHRNPSRFSGTGHFSSKFVTCVVTGNEKSEVEVQAYQASDQAMAIVGADIAEPSVDPSVVRIREDDGTSKRYVPDVFYRYKNAYGINVQESARPSFPVDYLLVSLTHGFPDKPNPLFVVPDALAFPIESRQGWQDQSSDKLFREAAKLLRRMPASIDADGFEVVRDTKGKGREGEADPAEALAAWLSDWHLLAYLDTLGVFDKVRTACLVAR
jgi:nuclear protein localization family protein 4